MSSVKELEGACRCGAGGSRNGLLDILWSGEGRGEAARRKGLLEAKLAAPGEGARWPDCMRCDISKDSYDTTKTTPTRMDDGWVQGRDISEIETGLKRNNKGRLPAIAAGASDMIAWIKRRSFKGET